MNSSCTVDAESPVSQHTQQHVQTFSDFHLRLKSELEENRQQRSERRRRHLSSSGPVNVAIPQTTDIHETKQDCSRSSKLQNDEWNSSQIAGERRTEKKASTHRQQSLTLILDRIHKRGSTVPISSKKEDDVDHNEEPSPSRNTSNRRQLKTVTPSKSPRNGRRRALKNSIRSIPPVHAETKDQRHQQQQSEYPDSAASAVSGESSWGHKSVSRSCSSSETYRGDSSQSSISHCYTESSSQTGIPQRNHLPLDPNTSIQIRRRKSAHSILLNESLSSLDHSSGNKNRSPINLFHNSDSDLLPAGGVHGNSLSLLHTSYSSLPVDDNDDNNHKTSRSRDRTSLHHCLSKHGQHQRREECLAELRQQQRQIAETLRHIQESPPIQAQNGPQVPASRRFRRNSWKGRNGAAD